MTSPKSKEQVVPEGGWQPIETAPKDGTEVLCYSPGNKAAMIINARSEHWHVDYVNKRWSAFYHQYPEAPYTHWMSLPTPPKGGEE